jgi:uncharacterized protein YceH (UPF0502 family)
VKPVRLDYGVRQSEPGREERAGAAKAIAQAVAALEPCEETRAVAALLDELEARIAKIDRALKVAELRSRLFVVRRRRGEP